MEPTNDEAVALEPRPAATLVLLRDTPQGPEVLLTTRSKQMRFMGGAVVFPGGAVSASDLQRKWEGASTHSRSSAAEALGTEDGAQALGAFVCALREAYEEVGFLIGSGPVNELKPHDACDAAQFLERCLELGIVLDTDQLVPAGRWVTPLGSPIRFDARFFVSRAPEGWEPTLVSKEVADCRWATPARALAELAEGVALMAPPTVEMLQRLDHHANVDDVLAGIENSSSQETGGILSARLSPLVVCVLAPNPGLLTGPGTNTYVVGSSPTLVMDPAVEDDDYIQAVLAAAGDIEAILVTHRHPDHVGGAARLAALSGASVRAFGPEPAGDAPVLPLSDGDIVAAGSARLEALHTPGHAADHLCFYMADAASLFAGDNILGEGTAVIPPDGDMGAYLASLERLRLLRLQRIYTGHFKPLDGGTAVIDGYLAHRAERERMVLAALDDARSAEAIVEIVYADTPGPLRAIAVHQVLAHLELLEERGQVTRTNQLWKRTSVE